MTQALVRLRNLSKAYGASIAVHPLDLDIAEGDFLAILGPSGCGKTTLLRMMGGFAEPTSGTIEINDPQMTMLKADVAPPPAVANAFQLARPTVKGYQPGSDSITSGRK